MGEREVLAAILNQSDPEGGVIPDPDRHPHAYWFPQADAILAAGFHL